MVNFMTIINNNNKNKIQVIDKVALLKIRR